MGFKRTPEGRVFFQGADTANDESAPRPNDKRPSNPAPQMRSPLTGEKTQGQIITLLKTLNERLKMTQADRDKMMVELEKHRTVIEDLEDKADRNERIALDLEDKLEKQSQQEPSIDPAITAKVSQTETLAQKTIKELEETRRVLVDMERNQAAQNKAITDKVSKSTSGFDALRSRLEQTESKQLAIEETVQSAVTQQEKLIRKVDKAIEDRARFMRKIERIEETVIQTRDSLNAKAMVLLTEQGVAANETALDDSFADNLDAQIEEAARLADIKAPNKSGDTDEDVYGYRPAAIAWWKNPAVYGAVAGITAFILAGLVIIGLALNDWQVPRFGAQQETPVQVYSQSPQASLESSLQEPVAPPPSRTSQNAQPIQNLNWEVETPTETSAAVQAPVNNDIGTVDLSNQEQVAALIESDPQKVAQALNEIEPQKQTPQTSVELAQASASPTNPVKAAPAPSSNEPNKAQAATINNEMKADGNLPNVIKDIEKQAFQGVGEAQHDLAAIYTAGHGGVKQNYERAAYWFEKAAENGIANASYNLGVLHHQGLGFTPDINTAMSWYKDAAAKGHPEAQYNLGIAYIEGIGVPYDPAKASDYFESAANNGVMEAAYNLGLIHENGLLGDAQPDNALMWYKIASDKGSPEAKQALTDLAKTLNIDLKDVNRIAESMRATNEIEKAAQTPKAAAPVKSSDKESSVIQPTTSNTPAAQPVDFSAYSSGAADRRVIAQIQEYLMRSGLYPGPADGMSGALTEDAIRSYQSLNDLNATGNPTQNLLSHMLANSNQSAILKDAQSLASRP